MLIQAIKEAVPLSPHLRFICSSPLKTPDKVLDTPSKIFFHKKAQELQRIKTQLENEKYERNMLEAEAKDNEEKIERLRKFVITFLITDSEKNPLFL